MSNEQNLLSAVCFKAGGTSADLELVAAIINLGMASSICFAICVL
mgnify:FL=1